MPRDSYYIEHGNPLRRELLPSRSLALSFAAPEAAFDKRMSAVLGLIVAVLVADAVDYSLTRLALVPNLRLLRCLALAVASAFVFRHFVRQKLLASHRRTLILCAAGSTIAATAELCLSDISFLRLLHAGLLAACYVALFGRHWTRLCMAAPVDRATALQMLAKWDQSVAVLALFPLFLAVLASIANPPLAACLAAATAVVCLFQSSPKRIYRQLRSAFAAFGSWLTYQPERQDVPGLFASPIGTPETRSAIALLSSLAVGICIRDVLPIPIVLPSLLAVLLPLVLLAHLLEDASAHRSTAVNPENWTGVVANIRASANPVERKSYYMGRVLADGSPLLIPRSVFSEHAHFLGDSGSGKTSLGLLPFIEQTIRFGDASLIVIDLKADSLELLATMTAAAKRLKQFSQIELPIKYLTTRDDFSTFAFNPFAQPFWGGLNSYKKTDLLLGATGLDYGADYGPAFYSSANAGVLHHTHETYPDAKSFEELADFCGHVLVAADPRDLNKEIRKHGVHVHEVLKRLGSFAPLNVAPNGSFSDEVVERAIDLADVFCRPQLLYFHLSSTLGPGTAPALARFVSFFLLASAVTAQRNVPVYLVIDEFQRMVARNFEYMLQLARSMGVGIILANQSMEDLKTSTADLIPTIEANCRYRQWFAVSSSADRERLARSSGETMEYFMTRGESSHSSGGTSNSVSISERVMPRLSANDIMLASDHPKQSIVRISRGAGYAQFGGLPVLCESDFHITREEYERRRQMPWPNRETGTFVPDEWAQQPPAPKPEPGPVVTTEVIGEKNADDVDPFEMLLNKLDGEQSNTATRRRKRR